MHLANDIEYVIFMYALLQIVLSELGIKALPKVAAHPRHVGVARVLHLVADLLV